MSLAAIASTIMWKEIRAEREHIDQAEVRSEVERVSRRAISAELRSANHKDFLAIHEFQLRAHGEVIKELMDKVANLEKAAVQPKVHQVDGKIIDQDLIPAPNPPIPLPE